LVASPGRPRAGNGRVTGSRENRRHDWSEPRQTFLGDYRVSYDKLMLLTEGGLVELN
jgi:hypothetical protein